MNYPFDKKTLDKKAKELFKEERAINHLDGWFLSRETAYNATKNRRLDEESKAAEEIIAVCKEIPLYISDNAVFAGTQRDAFARSYALINPAFKVEDFCGYCDPAAVYGDITPHGDLTEERISAMRKIAADSDYCRDLAAAYKSCETETAEILFFVEQVTGHVVPDFRYALTYGTAKLKSDIESKLSLTSDEEKNANYNSMLKALGAAEILASRYKKIAENMLKTATGERKNELELMIAALKKVPLNPCETLYEALQSFMLMWQVMCLEQAPNPFAFSVGNADRIFEPYRAKENLSRELAAGLFEHFLVFFNVGDRSWAISQNLIIGGKDQNGNDLTNTCSYALLDAYYEMNFPQPILSVKLHKNTPTELYEQLGRFWFTEGMLTPSLFNDDALFPILENSGVDKSEVCDYGIAGCQEPLISGKDNGNTTNSWLNLAKILEVTLTGGKSLLTGNKIIDLDKKPFEEVCRNLKNEFYANTERVIKDMVRAANGASKAVSHLRVPFLSCFMGGIETGYDMRDYYHQGTKYNGSGCLVHGLSVVADSLAVMERLLKERPEALSEIIPALKDNWNGHDELLSYVKQITKFGNADKATDELAAEIAGKVSDMIKAQKNYLGNPFRPDFSSPSTHLLYGYHVGASLDGRTARQMLGYGVDPLFGEAQNGLGFRLLSHYKLPFEKFNGGYASHLGIDPKNFTGKTYEQKGREFYEKIIRTLFFNPENKYSQPFYVYFNITTAETLRKVLKDPEKYAPSGVYIMRIHGTFVNFLDLSPDIQEDIILRLDAKSTSRE